MVKDWRAWLSDALILFGLAALTGTALFWVKTALATEQIKNRTYLLSSVDHVLPLPATIPAPLPTEVLLAPKAYTANALEVDELDEKKVVLFPNISVSSGLMADNQTQGDVTVPIESPTPTPRPPIGPIVRLVIPRLDIDSAVIPIGWNTEKLFASQNRPDLVGHLKTSVNPGDGSNVVLVGHNYNNSGYNWTGVFHQLKSLKPGDKIKVFTRNGGKFIYRVKKVKQIPWVEKKGAELEKHLNFIHPKPKEQLTLVTCGGDFFWTWSARVYVVALPVDN
jgi:LPXTG-site transpeptidase (sortase) family protein